MSLLFIRILKWIVNAAWYLLIPLMAIVTVIIAVKIRHMGYLLWDIPVDIKQVDHLPVLASVDGSYQMAGVNAASALLKVKVQLTPAIVAEVIVFFSASMFLLFGILYHLRKILNSLKANTPFAFENIRRLRFISLFVFLMAVVMLVNSLLNFFLLPAVLPDLTAAYRIQVDWGFKPVLVSLIVFVLSEIFRQGYHLKTDNESFV